MANSEKRAFCPECERQFATGQKYCPEDGALLLTYDVVDVVRDDPLLGEVLDDRFRIERPLSQGGMGKVYLGSQMGVERKVAIKVLLSDPAEGEASVRRFLREAHTLSNFSHPNIVNFIDFGQDPERRALYLVMELIDGCDLGQLLGKGRLRVDLAVEIAIQLCAGLTEPHEHGIVHRDLKPANLMLLKLSDGSLQVKLVDFGIADAVDGRTKVTKTGAVIGTPNYMAPEQAENTEVTPASDIYSIGALLYHMLSGNPMYDAQSDLQLIFKHVQEEPPPLESLPHHRNFPVGLFSLFHKLVAKSPDERPDSILEVRRELLEIARRSGISEIELDSARTVEEALEPWVIAPGDDPEPMEFPDRAHPVGPEGSESEGAEFEERTHVGFGPTVLNDEDSGQETVKPRGDSDFLATAETVPDANLRENGGEPRGTPTGTIETDSGELSVGDPAETGETIGEGGGNGIETDGAPSDHEGSSPQSAESNLEEPTAPKSDSSSDGSQTPILIFAVTVGFLAAGAAVGWYLFGSNLSGETGETIPRESSDQIAASAQDNEPSSAAATTDAGRPDTSRDASAGTDRDGSQQDADKMDADSSSDEETGAEEQTVRDESDPERGARSTTRNEPPAGKRAGAPEEREESATSPTETRSRDPEPAESGPPPDKSPSTTRSPSKREESESTPDSPDPNERGEEARSPKRDETSDSETSTDEPAQKSDDQTDPDEDSAEEKSSGSRGSSDDGVGESDGDSDDDSELGDGVLPVPGENSDD